MTSSWSSVHHSPITEGFKSFNGAVGGTRMIPWRYFICIVLLENSSSQYWREPSVLVQSPSTCWFIPCLLVSCGYFMHINNSHSHTHYRSIHGSNSSSVESKKSSGYLKQLCSRKKTVRSSQEINCKTMFLRPGNYRAVIYEGPLNATEDRSGGERV